MADDHTKLALGAEEQKEVTRREVLLREIGARLYRQQLNADYEHDIRTRNLDIQEHEKRSQIDTLRITTIDDNTARNTRREIREHLKSAVIEKLVEHRLSENAKRTAAAQELELELELELERMEDESRHRTTEIREESAANEREMWTKNEVDKDFELFMVDLRKKTTDWQTEDVEAVLRKLRGLD